MINYIWVGMMCLSFMFGIYNNCLPEVSLGVTEGVRGSVDMLIGVFGILVFWTGLLKIAEKSGMVDSIGYAMYRPIHFLFPEVPKGHPAVGAIAMILTANAVGLDAAATPLGMKAMEELDTLNPCKGEATNAMCMLVTINASNIQLMPIATMGLLSLYGAQYPVRVLIPATIATLFSTVFGVVLVSYAKRFYPEKMQI